MHRQQDNQNMAQKQQRDEQLMRDLMNGLEEMFPDFYLTLIMHHKEIPAANYISNATRETMIEALRDMAIQLETQNDMPPVAADATVQ